MQIVDRYTALGIGRPDVSSICKGDCEGTGIVPIYFLSEDQKENRVYPIEDPDDEVYREAWDKAEKENPAEDGCHFLLCKDCGGTGKELQLDI